MIHLPRIDRFEYTRQDDKWQLEGEARPCIGQCPAPTYVMGVQTLTSPPGEGAGTVSLLQIGSCAEPPAQSASGRLSP